MTVPLNLRRQVCFSLTQEKQETTQKDSKYRLFACYIEQTKKYSHWHKVSYKFFATDKTLKEHEYNVVYKAHCPQPNCNETYIGETTRRHLEREFKTKECEMKITCCTSGNREES